MIHHRLNEREGCPVVSSACFSQIVLNKEGFTREMILHLASSKDEEQGGEHQAC